MFGTEREEIVLGRPLLPARVYKTRYCKLNLSPCLMKHYTMTAYWGMEEHLHQFLTLSIDASV
jgi:hypothetical protein